MYDGSVHYKPRAPTCIECLAVVDSSQKVLEDVHMTKTTAQRCVLCVYSEDSM